MKKERKELQAKVKKTQEKIGDASEKEAVELSDQCGQMKGRIRSLTQRILRAKK